MAEMTESEHIQLTCAGRSRERATSATTEPMAAARVQERYGGVVF